MILQYSLRIFMNSTQVIKLPQWKQQNILLIKTTTTHNAMRKQEMPVYLERTAIYRHLAQLLQ